MIEKNGYGDFASFDLTCDECGDSENFDTQGDFFQAVADAKESGWEIQKDGTDWKHICPNCVD